MSLTSFHPVVARWFSETFGEPTQAQRKGWEAIRARRHTLIVAPTGSGKTLAAFLTALDELLQEGLRSPLPDEIRIIYVSPLKALSADIHKNLTEPRNAIRRIAREMGLDAPRITAAVRTGDTTQSERAAMLRTPPHILVTTPESLYLLLTAERSRERLRTATTVIVDEIHALIGTRRGAHLALSLERLQQVTVGPLLRLGLSATQRPIDEVARFLVGAGTSDGDVPECTIVNEGHMREMDLAVEVPRSPLEAVMSHEVWEEYYDRLTELVESHRTTLVFVNTRRLAERVTRQLSDRLGADAVTAHHGSLSKERRQDAESRLKDGTLKALVATASLELGIDIGHVDLVCQIGSPRWISTFLQRIGRAGHTVRGTPKGRLFPMSLDDLVECAALLRAVRSATLDRLVRFDGSLDVLAQQIVAESACAEYREDELFALVRRADPYRALDRAQFDGVVDMLAAGFATRRGRRGALVHRDEVNSMLRGRRAARLTAIVAGGAIPELADYRVVMDPDDTFVGTINEDFAIESSAGDIFQLGNSSWRILQVGSGTVRVQDAQGAPPTIPFWLGEAPGRSAELSEAVSRLRTDLDMRLREGDDAEDERTASATRWLAAEAGISDPAAEQAVTYLAAARRALGVLPSQKTLVLERFFDDSGGMQLVLHAPFGSRVNRAWGLALRKRFCRQFNFELQAAATDDGLLLSLGPQHSFPLADVFRYLHPATVREILVQAFLDAPVFKTRWRWNATISLAVLRNRGGKKVPPPLQRMQADDLMAAVFPDAAACLENIPGDRTIPDHPLVTQTVTDCLEEAMDLPRLAEVLSAIHSGEIACVARDTPEPSPLCHEILNARPYAFLDDAPLEERRAHAVYARRATEHSSAGALGALDPGAIARVRTEAWPDPRNADELHDALLTSGFFLEGEQRLAETGAVNWPGWFATLCGDRRATRVILTQPGAAGPDAPESGGPSGAVRVLWVAAERLPELRAAAEGGTVDVEPDVVPPPRRAHETWTSSSALVELLRGRISILGPCTPASVAGSLGIAESRVDEALLALEADGAILRGSFTSDGDCGREWCDRALLARIHRYTLNRLRAEIEPVTPADFMRFLFVWQHVDPSSRLAGPGGVRAAIEQLDGFDVPVAAWERDVLAARVEGYDPAALDLLCLSGETGWARLSTSGSGPGIRPLRTTPVALFLREHAHAWQLLRPAAVRPPISERGRNALALLERRGASFAQEIEHSHQALAELASAGLVTADGFGALRAMVQTTPRAATAASSAVNAAGSGSPGQPRTRAWLAPAAGRWSLVPAIEDDGPAARQEAIELLAWTLLRRYGVVFRRLLAREPHAVSWRELATVYRRLEARGEIRGGRFVNGMSGEQFALADAVTSLREVRRSAPHGGLLVISASDPLNLAGVVTAGEPVPARARTRIAYRDGVPLAALEGDYIRQLSEYDPSMASVVARALAGRPVPPVMHGYIGRAG